MDLHSSYGEGRRIWRKTGPITFSWATAASVLLSICFVITANKTGFTEILDSKLSEYFYAIRGERISKAEVIHVALDDDTISHWGAPPWSWEQVGPMFEAIHEGTPGVVAILEPYSRLFTPRQGPEEMWEAVNNGSIWVSESALPRDLPRTKQSALALVNSIALGAQNPDLRQNITNRLLTYFGHDFKSELSFTVNYLGHDSLPKISAYKISNGEIPKSTFDNRAVLIGSSSEWFGAFVSTPVGDMSVAEVHSHAFTTLTDNASWSKRPDTLLFLLTCLLIGSIHYFIQRVRTKSAFAFLIGTIIGCLVLDYLLFANEWIRLQSASMVIGTLFASASCLWFERERVQQELEGIIEVIPRRWIDEGLSHHNSPLPKETFWEEILFSVQRYVAFESAVVGTLKPGSWHLDWAALINTNEEEILQRRRDIRRHPYRDAYLMHRPAWSEEPFVSSDEPVRSLIVPLVAFRRLIAVWVINFHKDQVVSQRDMEILSMMTVHAAVRASHSTFALASNLEEADGFLTRQANKVSEISFNLAQGRRRSAQTIYDLPSPILTASVWGVIEFANEPMRRLLDAHGIPSIDGQDLHTVLSKICDAQIDEITNNLRDLCGTRSDSTMTTRGLDLDAPVYDLIISRTGASKSGSTDELDVGTSRIVVVGHPRRPSAMFSLEQRLSSFQQPPLGMKSNDPISGAGGGKSSP